MVLRDISDCKQIERYYGGLSCQKMGITLDGKNYMMKLPGNLKSRDMKNVVLSYSNSPVCEYIGSHIFELFGIDTHKTELAIYKGKVVVLCEDFLEYGDTLYEFRQLKATYADGFITPDGELSDGTGADIDEALLVIRNHIAYSKFPEYELLFWKMFIIDALIGNSDRNNGNYGIIQNSNNSRIAPIYDNGNCLNPTWDDAKMCTHMKSGIEQEAFLGKTCFFTKGGKPVNPFQLILRGEYPLCTKALYQILLDLDLYKIYDIIYSIPCLTNAQAIWYKEVLGARARQLIAILPDNSVEMQEYARKIKLDYKDLVSKVYEQIPTLWLVSSDKETCAVNYWDVYKSANGITL